MTATGHVRVTVDRGSVAMGDDVESHVQFWEMPAEARVDDLLVAIAESFVLPLGSWCVWLNLRDDSRRRVLGFIWPDGHRGEATRVSQYGSSDTLGSLAHDGELIVDAVYLSQDRARPTSVTAVMARDTFTGARPVVLGSQARADRLFDWRRAADDRSRADAVRDTRWAWVREHLLTRASPPGAESFIAENFHFLTDLLCPASMRLAGELVGVDGLDTGHQTVQRLGDPGVATLAMVIAAFEWGLKRTEIARVAEGGYGRAYLEFLAALGYPLSEVEHLMAGRGGLPEQLTPQQARIRELRNSEYNLTRNHRLGVVDHQLYEQLLAPVVRELVELGEQPEPRDAPQQ